MKRLFLFGVLALGLFSVPAVAGEYHGGYRDSYRDSRSGHDGYRGDSYRRYDSHRHHDHHRVYRVLYRTSHCDWRVHGTYHSYERRNTPPTTCAIAATTFLWTVAEPLISIARR